MSEIKYVVGDATRPEGDGARLIAHICNTHGRWGAGFTLAVSKRWEAPERCFRYWYKVGMYENIPFGLGNIQVVNVGYSPQTLSDRGISVVNMVAQDGLMSGDNPRPVCYNSVRTCLRTLGEEAKRLHAKVHMPRIGCGLGGGSWDEIEPLIREELVARGISVSVYDLRKTSLSGEDQV